MKKGWLVYTLNLRPEKISVQNTTSQKEKPTEYFTDEGTEYVGITK